MTQNLEKLLSQNVLLGTNISGKMKLQSSNNPERITKKNCSQKNAKCMSGDGIEVVVIPMKASSNLKMRMSWIFTGGIRRFTMHSPIVGTSVKILVLLNLMNLTQWWWQQPVPSLQCSIPPPPPQCSIDTSFPISGRAFLWAPTGPSTFPTSRSMADSLHCSLRIFMLETWDISVALWLSGLCASPPSSAHTLFSSWF